MRASMPATGCVFVSGFACDRHCQGEAPARGELTLKTCLQPYPYSFRASSTPPVRFRSDSGRRRARLATESICRLEGRASTAERITPSPRQQTSEKTTMSEAAPVVAPAQAARARARGGGGRRGRASKNTSQAAETNQSKGHARAAGRGTN